MINFIFLTYQKKNIKETKQNKGTAERGASPREMNILCGEMHYSEINM